MKKNRHNKFNLKPFALFRFCTTVIISTGVWGSVQAGGLVCHVSEDGIGDGSSWLQSTDLSLALADTECAEIWVKAGTYYPTDGLDPTVSFLINRTLKLYGGFLGTETNLTQRIPGQYPSILSGNIGDEADNEDNSNHVVYVDGSTLDGPIISSTEINGFTITQGYGLGAPKGGAGLYCKGIGSGSECSPLLDNINFIENVAYIGGALFNDGNGGGVSSPVVLNSTFAFNSSSFAGGAFYNEADDSSSVSSPIFENVTFYANHSDILGGVMYSRAFSGDSSPTIINSTFYLNSSEQRGGVFSVASTTSRPTHLTLLNSIFWSNTAVIDGDLIHPNTLVGTFSDNVIDTDCPFSIGTVSCNNIIIDNPMLSNFKNHGGFTPTVLPGPLGSAIDTAFTDNCPDSDQRGVLRPQGIACDIGAVEMTESDEVIFKNGFEDLLKISN